MRRHPITAFVLDGAPTHFSGTPLDSAARKSRHPTAHLAVVHPGVLLLELLGFSHQGLQEKTKRKGNIKDKLLDHVLHSGQSVFILLAPFLLKSS